MLKKIFIVASCLTTFAFGDITLDIEKFITGADKLLVVKSVIQLQVNDIVKITTSSGESYVMKITSREDNAREHVRIYGQSQSNPNCGFGIYMNVNGVLAAAIVDQDKDKTFSLEFLPEANGYMFIRKFNQKLEI